MDNPNQIDPAVNLLQQITRYAVLMVAMAIWFCYSLGQLLASNQHDNLLTLIINVHQLRVRQEAELTRVVNNYCQHPQLLLPHDYLHADQLPPPPPPPAHGGSSSSEGSTGESSASDTDTSYGEGVSPADQPTSSPSSAPKRHSVFQGNTADVDGPNAFPYRVAIGEAPWPARLYKPVDYQLMGRGEMPIVYPITMCGGSILNSKTVLTAAHCIYSSAHDYYVMVGTTCRPETGGVYEQRYTDGGTVQIIKVKKSFRYWLDDAVMAPQTINNPLVKFYNSNEPLDHPEPDLAILELEEPIHYIPGQVERINLAEQGRRCQDEWHLIPDGTHRLSMAGWGMLLGKYGNVGPDPKYPTRLQWLDMHDPSDDDVTFEQFVAMQPGSQYANEIEGRCNGSSTPDNGWICIPYAPGMAAQSCKGDSGSPLVRRRIDGTEPELLGVLSWGTSQNAENPQILTDSEKCGDDTFDVFARLCGQTRSSVLQKAEELIFEIPLD